MGVTRDDGMRIENRCLDNLKPGEPFFVLRGQDELAPEIVRYWVQEARKNDYPPEKAKEVLRFADEMEKWQPRKFPD